MQAILDYSLNKFCPLIIIGFLIFSNLTLNSWEPWVIMGMVLFVERFSFKVGYSVAFCEKNNISTE